jgi:multisubunit Na+/H+ antiporter MnhB subunit
MPSVFDILLSVSLLLLAWHSLSARDLFHGVVLFVMFGLFVAITWLRLHAPDIALAEVAIGAGLTGALFLGTLGRMESNKVRNKPPGPDKHPFITALVASLFAALCVVTVNLADGGPGLGDEVTRHLDASGVKNPVTAVVLNFRGYDTLFEIGVLFLALLGTHAVHQTVNAKDQSLRLPRDSMLVIFVRIVTPILILTAAYMVWVGDHEPGGAFQAGAILGGAGVIILLSGIKVSLGLDRWYLRLAGIIGFAVFIVTGVCLMSRGHFLEYPSSTAKVFLLVIELACAVSIGFILASLFAACASLLHPTAKPGERNE